MIRTILVPLDGSAFGEQAVAWAALVAARAKAEVHLVHVLEPLIVGDPMMQYTMVDVETPDEARGYMADLLRRHPEAAAAKNPVMAVLDGPVTAAIEDYAKTHSIDLTVMVTHGRGPFARFWEGSVADSLVRGLMMPLLLVRATEETPAPAPPSSGFRHVLIAVNGTRTSEEIMPPATEMARLFDSAVTLLRVIPPHLESFERSTQPPPVEDVHLHVPPEERPTPERELDRLAAKLRAAQLITQPVIAEHDQPEKAIIAEAKRLGCDLVALETHGRSGLSRLLLGSVTDKVIRNAECPVLIHHAGSKSHQGEKK
jgi:nucleotide-binding universal stress UspA family protein